MSSILKRISLRLLKEADEEEEKEPGNDSIDSQVDKFLVNYEKQATKSKNEGRDFRSMTRNFLFEAEEDEEEDEPEEEPEEPDEEDEGDKSESEDEDAEDEEEEKLTSEDIDLQSFAGDVVRLVENFESLLEVNNTILRRAANFLSKNYDKETVEQFKQELSTKYGIEIGKSELEMKDDYRAPNAAMAGPAGGGA